jgi:hypothetical protein
VHFLSGANHLPWEVSILRLDSPYSLRHNDCCCLVQIFQNLVAFQITSNTKLTECLRRWAWPLLREYNVLKAQRYACRFTGKFINTVTWNCTCVFRTVLGGKKSLYLLAICYKKRKIHFSKCRNTSIIIVLYSVFIMCGNGTSCHYRLFITITVCHVISLARTKARKQLSTRTPLGLVSGLLAILTHKTYVLNLLLWPKVCKGIRVTWWQNGRSPLAKSRLNPTRRQVMKVTTTPLLAVYQQIWGPNPPVWALNLEPMRRYILYTPSLDLLEVLIYL